MKNKMKIENSTPGQWHWTLGTAALAATLLLTGCVVTSVYPFYTEKDLVFDAALLGDWVSADDEAKPGEFMRIEKFGGQGYRVTAFTADATNSVDFHLFRLGKNLLLDSCPTN